MTEYDRRGDDEWRGQIAARVKAIEERLASQDARAAVLGESITSIRVDMTAMRSILQTTADAVKQDAEDQKKERDEVIADLRGALKQKSMNRLAWSLAIIGPIIALVVGSLILLAITGSLGPK